MNSPVMLLGEVAAHLRIHNSTVYRMIRRGELPFFRVGSEYRFHRPTIEAWTREQTTKSALELSRRRSSE
jgi:excisionase family DNA binding protein